MMNITKLVIMPGPKAAGRDKLHVVSLAHVGGVMIHMVLKYGR